MLELYTVHEGEEEDAVRIVAMQRVSLAGLARAHRFDVQDETFKLVRYAVCVEITIANPGRPTVMEAFSLLEDGLVDRIKKRHMRVYMLDIASTWGLDRFMSLFAAGGALFQGQEVNGHDKVTDAREFQRRNFSEKRRRVGGKRTTRRWSCARAAR